MDTRYDFKKIEEKIYKKWLPYLHIKEAKNKKNIVFLMAPPNITGNLHLGHSLENTIIDILIRYHRMKGLNPVWIPGIDHAGIATQNVVEKKLRKEGISRFDLGKEKFIEKCWEWKNEYGNIILEQFKKLGITPDWSRVKFTMDKAYIEQVEKAFVEYYKKGLIYRDLRPINFCPRCKTGLSDLEIEWKSKTGKLYYIHYPILNSKIKNLKFITVATTRPETMLGDTAIAVNPRDKRYKNLVGGIVILPIIKREILIIADTRVDPNFGTGALKITPAHSMIDYEISKRHGLKMEQVIDENGQMINAQEYNGLNYLAAREKIIEKLEQEKLLEKIEDYEHEIPHCDRCKTEIQVIPSLEWFVRMKELDGLAKQSVKSKKTQIIPARYKKQYFDWLNNIRDWCISRKLWWGQALPVWLCQTGRAPKLQITNYKLQNNFVVSLTQPKKCPFCKNCKMQHTDEVFDTWFSSALWPFAILYTKEEKKWYPAFLVSSARDILHLWITRMIFSGMFFKKKEPFKNVFIHPTIQTKEGKRMSKSLGTGIDPIDLIEKHGADALRFGLIWQMSSRQDLRFDENFVITGQKFATKIWNAARFCVFQTQNRAISKQTPNPKLQTLNSTNDKKIIKSFNDTLSFVEKKISEFKFEKALQKIYKFFWNDFCDKYLETCKSATHSSLKGDEENNPEVLQNIIKESIKLISLFMPFVAEELWSSLGNKNLLLLEKWPRAL